MIPQKQSQGFSLVEVLITLTILGIIATFTIPKLFAPPPNSTMSNKQTTMAKNVAFMILNAYEQYRIANGTVPTTMTALELTPYMNYVSLDTTNSRIDHRPSQTFRLCAPAEPCLILHNGSKLRLGAVQFAGSNTTNCLQFHFDPDGIYSGSTADSYSKSVQFQLYYDGTIRTFGNAKASSCHSVVCPFSGVPSNDPSWFTGF
jgi:prepilin-type N-terminal cleavage/methylation domain-containing protein